jgi:iron complex outermembrane receptor protein
LPSTPPWAASLAVDYSLVSSIGKIVPTISASYNGNFYYYADNRLRQPRYTLLNSSVDWTLPGDRLDIELAATNLTNATYYEGKSEQLAPLNDVQRRGAPRLYGITFRTRF